MGCEKSKSVLQSTGGPTISMGARYRDRLSREQNLTTAGRRGEIRSTQMDLHPPTVGGGRCREEVVKCGKQGRRKK